MSNERKLTLSQVMNLAWQFVKHNGFNVSQALKASWANIKMKSAMALSDRKILLRQSGRIYPRGLRNTQRRPHPRRRHHRNRGSRQEAAQD